MNYNDDPAKIVIIYDDPKIVIYLRRCQYRHGSSSMSTQDHPTWQTDSARSISVAHMGQAQQLGLFMIFFLLILDRYMGQNPTFRPFYSPFICYFGPLYNPIIFYFRLFTVYLFFIFSFCVRWVPIVSFNQRVGPNHQVLTFSQLINNQCANQK